MGEGAAAAGAGGEGENEMQTLQRQWSQVDESIRSSPWHDAYLSLLSQEPPPSTGSPGCGGWGGGCGAGVSPDARLLGECRARAALQREMARLKAELRAGAGVGQVSFAGELRSRVRVLRRLGYLRCAKKMPLYPTTKDPQMSPVSHCKRARYTSQKNPTCPEKRPTDADWPQ